MPGYPAKSIAAFGLALMAVSGRAGPPVPDALFVQESQRAMSRMMAGMDAPVSGNTDRDFATMMIPHHQGAIDMAVSELKYGHDPRLRRIAEEIVVDQQQEIVVMRAALDAGRTAPRTDPATMIMDTNDGRIM